MRPGTFCLLFRVWGALSLLPAAAVPLRAEITIEEIVENVRRNEALYDNLHATVHAEYRVSEDQRPIKSSEGGGMSFLMSRSTRTKFVSQEGLFRLDREGTYANGDGEFSSDRISAFDGKLTRIYDRKAIGNLVSDRREDPSRIRPHMLILRHSNFRCALSTFLSGEAARGDELAMLQGDQTRNVEYHGEADFNALKCQIVWVRCLTKPGREHGRWEIWLAEDRNYIPVRRIDIRYIVSETIPEGDGVVEELREIEPGIWFPFSVRATGYDPGTIMLKGVQKFGWEEHFVTEEASLHPHYPARYFSDVPMPDGTAVYEVQGGKIGRSYVKGAPDAPSGGTAVGAQRWLIVANIVIAAVAAGLVASRFWRKERPAHSTREPTKGISHVS